MLPTTIDLIKENLFTLEAVRQTRYPAETMTNPDFVDEQPLLPYVQTQAESVLHPLEQEVGSTDFYVKSNKKVYMF